MAQEQTTRQENLKGIGNQVDECRKSANNEVSLVLKKLEAMEEKCAHMESLVARLASTLERFLDDKHESGFAKTPGTKQVLFSFTTWIELRHFSYYMFACLS